MDMRVMKQDDDQEMSMEEILASIRKYVTDDGAAPSHHVPLNASSAQGSSAASQGNAPEAGTYAHGEEEVLDLKKVHSFAEHRHEAPAAPAPAPMPAASPAAPQTFAPSQSSAPSVTPSYPTYAASTPQAPAQSANPISSGKTMTSSAQALSRLVNVAKSANEPQPSAQVEVIGQASQGIGSLAGGMTLEQLTIQAMMPLLQKWMDANLPSLVERLVQKEIENITAELLQKK